jgi:hypothetical protein
MLGRQMFLSLEPFHQPYEFKFQENHSGVTQPIGIMVHRGKYKEKRIIKVSKIHLFQTYENVKMSEIIHKIVNDAQNYKT